MAEDIESAMSDTNTEDMGKISRHPLRSTGTAFLIGLGAGMMAAKMRKESKSPLQRFMDQLGM